MANADTPHGLTPVGHMSGSDVNGRVIPCYAPSSYETGLFLGDPVLMNGTSNTGVVTVVGGGSFEIGTLPDVVAATVGDGNSISGVVVGQYPVTRDSTVYGAADTERVLLVNVDPYTIYRIQADGAVPAASVGLNAVLIATHAGSTTTGISGMELDTTSDAPAADVSNQLTILRLVNSPDNETNLLHNEVDVLITNHTYAKAQIGL
jgi:hypothetical protein